jgi:PAS domain S-box-containing protein
MEQRFQSIFNHVNEGILIANGQGVIESVNPRVLEMFDYSEEELLGSQVEMLVPMSARSRHVKHRAGYHENPHSRPMGQNMFLEGLKKGGGTFPIEISLSTYESQGEKHVIAFIIDVSERKLQDEKIKQAYSALQTLNNSLEKKVLDRTLVLEEALAHLEASKADLFQALQKERELNELKSRFVSTASHEFRTPLSTISSSVSLIERYGELADFEKQKKHISRIHQSVKGLTDILEDILSLSKLEEGKVVLSTQEVQLDLFMEEMLDELQPILREGQFFQSQFQKEVRGITEPKILRNILINLLSNAIKFSPENHPIHVVLKEENGLVEIEVRDQGVGIPSFELPRLFERFHRASNAINVPGTGLGLSIVKKCLELLNGNIHVESKLQEGTSFIISFKIR